MISRDVLLLVFDFVHLSEWGNWRLLSKRHCNQVGNLYKFMQHYAKRELQKILINVVDTKDYKEFWTCFIESKSCISGSILLQCLLGKDIVKANNIDIFTFGLSNSFFTFCDKKTTNIIDNRRNHISNLYFTKNLRIGQYSTSTRSLLNVIGVSDDVKYHIREEFDFACCTSYFDGTTMTLNGIGDMFRQELNINPRRQKWIKIYHPSTIKKYYQRIEKYEDRGFVRKTRLKPGKYHEIYDKIYKSVELYCKDIDDILNTCKQKK